MVADAGAGFQEQPFYEYHLYTCSAHPRGNNEQKQIALFPNATVGKVEKEYLLSSSNNSPKVKVFLSFLNKEDNQLGIPLPAGKMRIYKPVPMAVWNSSARISLITLPARRR
jgi:hypothetical protein